MKSGSIISSPLFTISLGKLEFSPSLIPSLLTVAFLYLLISLGQWQLHRADFKSNIQNTLNERQNQQPVELENAPEAIDDRMFLPVKTRGELDVKHQILLDNRVLDHQPGYTVYIPLLRKNAPAVLVDRGWIAMGRSRQDIPDISVEAVETNVSGLLGKPPSHGLILSSNVNQYEQWPAVAQFIDLKEIESALGYPLYPLVLRLDEANKIALQHEPFSSGMKSDKHQAYAFQWFGLATALVIIYLVVNTRRRK